MRHEHAHRAPRAAIEPGGELVTEDVVATAPFAELLASWNVAVPGGAGFEVDVRVRAVAGAQWSPWLRIGRWGARDFDAQEATGATTHCALGRIDVDWFRSDRAFDRASLRFRPIGGAVVVERFDLCFTARDAAPRDDGGARGGAVAIDVPTRSQRSLPPPLADRVCSPTALAMVLAYRGVDVETERVAALAYDATHDLYGNWGNAIQAAFALGVPGYLTRVADWREVERAFAGGQPLVASIGVVDGELSGAPYRKTAGHLIVIRGFDERGDVLVNDPAAEPGAERRVYRRAELARAWLDRGGTAYVLLPRPGVTRDGARAD